jgi:basic membrane protein A
MFITRRNSMKKHVLSLVVIATLVMSVFAGCGSSKKSEKQSEGSSDYKIAMITDSGDITDMSFNQTTYEASKAFAKDHDAKFSYYKPTEDSDEARIASFNNAVADGYNVVVVPGYLFANMIKSVAESNPDVKIIALDCGEGDFSNDGSYKLPGNVACFTYAEELSGYMAGYAAVKEGYKKLGYLGGMAVPAVIRFGYGFLQGVDAAAVEMGITNEVEVNYIYGGQFSGDSSITAVMDTWYKGGTEVVFACGGGIYTSACEAAVKAGGKVIGVDTDQSGTIAKTYGDDSLCITSAMKGLAPTINTTLQAIFDGKWDSYAGTFSNLGLVSGDDPSQNYVQLPTDTWSMKNFSVDDYKALVKDLYDGKFTVSNDTKNAPKTTIKVTTFDNIH